MNPTTAILYIQGRANWSKEIDLSAYKWADQIPTVIVYNGLHFVYNRIAQRGRVAEYYDALTLVIPSSEQNES